MKNVAILTASEIADIILDFQDAEQMEYDELVENIAERLNIKP